MVQQYEEPESEELTQKLTPLFFAFLCSALTLSGSALLTAEHTVYWYTKYLPYLHRQPYVTIPLCENRKVDRRDSQVENVSVLSVSDEEESA